MKSFFFVLVLAAFIFGGAFYLGAFDPVERSGRSRIGDEIRESIPADMLQHWYPLAADLEHGGFLSTFTYDWKPTMPQDKMIVTQARHVWSNARARQLYPDVPHYESLARHGFAFLRNVMWDETYGGFHTLVGRQGRVKSKPGEEKTAYGNTFAIYGLAAYYQASGDTAALSLAKETFHWLEAHSHDPVHKGYFQHMERNGSPIHRTEEVPSKSDLGYKDQNSSIHLLEAFTELYTVWPDSLLRERLEEMLLLVRDTITQEKGSLVLFFEPDWTPVSFRDSTKNTILEHRYLDHVSFGHDVETAYLMLEASHVLGIEDDEQTMQVAKKMLDHALRNGWDEKLGGFYDQGYYFKGDEEISIINDHKNWWSQAEGLNTLLLMADHFPDDELEYFKKFQQLWAYINEYLIDQEYGGWYEGGLDKQPELRTALKGHIWKGNYHQFRSLVHCMHRLLPDTIPPASPSDIILQEKEAALVLDWEKAVDNELMMGYDIYRNGNKIGFTPLASFQIPASKVEKGDTFSVKAMDLQGNTSVEAVEVEY